MDASDDVTGCIFLSNVPFRKGRVDRLSTVLKTLEAINFRPQDFLFNGVFSGLFFYFQIFN
jgi:hypothetical protein